MRTQSLAITPTRTENSDARCLRNWKESHSCEHDPADPYGAMFSRVGRDAQDPILLAGLLTATPFSRPATQRWSRALGREDGYGRGGAAVAFASGSGELTRDERWREINPLFQSMDSLGTDSTDQTPMPRDEGLRFEMYKIALETMRYEGLLLWQIFAVFLAIQALFSGFLLQAVVNSQLLVYNPKIWSAGFIGLFLCMPWYASYSRNAYHYRYHLARVRSLEPAGWHLYADEGQVFSAGKGVLVRGQLHKLRWYARLVRSGRMIPPVIILFMISYAIVILCSGPWWRSPDYENQLHKSIC